MYSTNPRRFSFVVTRHQKHHLKAGLTALETLNHQMGKGVGEELLIEDLNAVIEQLNSFMQEISKADAINEVFEHFCVGK